jgi:hypothetical protein
MNLKNGRVKFGFLSLLMAVFCIWVYAAHSTNSQSEDKILEKGKDYDPPVKITLVKSKIGVIETDRKLSAGDDWLKGLMVRVRNDSDKPVTSVIIYIQFRRPENQARELDLVASIPYGQNPFAPPEESSQVPAEPIFPGQTKDISLPDQAYDSLRSELDRLNYPANIKAVKIQVRTIGFIDGTAWSAGQIFRRDPNKPDKWIGERPSRSSVKKRYAVSQSRIH